MIVLNENCLIGEGAHRKCFLHPSDSRFCIKVNKPQGVKEREREQAYYARLYDINIDWDLLARYHGEINTNLGRGDIFDLIKDDTNTPAKTLEYYLNHSIPDGIERALAKLRIYLIENSIITTSLKPRNIVCQIASGVVVKTVIVDDIGNTEFIPLSSMSKLLARFKIERKWQRFSKQLSLYGIDV